MQVTHVLRHGYPPSRPTRHQRANVRVRCEKPIESKQYRTKRRNNARDLSRDEAIPIARVGPGPTSDFYSSKSWKFIGANDEIIEGLGTLGISRPSHIQAESFGALVNPDAMHVLLADHAGSGKTLSYLVPLIQKMKEEEKKSQGPVGKPGRPRVVVIVPTAELCTQVLRVCRALSRTLKFRSAIFTGGHPMRTHKQNLSQGLDVVIGTPGRLLELYKNGSLQFDNCSHVVCDEADVLFGPASSFAEQVVPIKENCSESTKFVLVTATLPSDIYTDIEFMFPGIVSALGPGLHRTAPGCVEQIIDCSGGAEISEESGILRKSAAMLASLQEQKSSRTIVFCNKIETCRKVENFLNRSILEDDTEVLPYHAAVSPIQRDKNLSRFLHIPKDSANKVHGEETSKRLILVCTDRASRGVDSAYVEHVILFDFPREPSEYVRRVGRTARGAGGQGVVTVLVLGRQVKLAQHVSSRNQKGLPVHAIPPVIPIKHTKQ